MREVYIALKDDRKAVVDFDKLTEQDIAFIRDNAQSYARPMELEDGRKAYVDFSKLTQDDYNWLSTRLAPEKSFGESFKPIETAEQRDPYYRTPIEYRIRHPDGTFKYLVSEGHKEYEGGKPVRIFAIVQDITERKKQEETIKTALEEKHQLIRELYHRTKNNMQVIISMLMLQAMQYEDENIRELVKITVNRIQTMSLVHEKLYQSEKLSTIKLDEYINDLTQLLVHTFRISSDKVNIVCDLQPIPALIDIAIPCGLIINELVSNAIKYAFPGKRTGTIKIELHPKDDGFISLRVSDNGIGVPPDFDFRSGKTIGLQTVAEITELQLQGTMDIERGTGFSCCVQFKNSLYRKRI